MMLMAGGEDLMMIFLGLELMSVAVYVLAGINRRSAPAAEAALKYFLLGAFASGFLLYGIALAYGATAATNLTLIGVQVTTLGLQKSTMLLIGLGLLLVGFGFKVAAVPFHMWAPDVDDGSPTPVTGYMATAVRSEEHTSELQSHHDLVCRLLLEKKKKKKRDRKNKREKQSNASQSVE